MKTVSSRVGSFESCQTTSITCSRFRRQRLLVWEGQFRDFWRRWIQKTVAQVVDYPCCILVCLKTSCLSEHMITKEQQTKEGRTDLFNGLGNIYYEIKEIALIRYSFSRQSRCCSELNSWFISDGINVYPEMEKRRNRGEQNKKSIIVTTAH